MKTKLTTLSLFIIFLSIYLVNAQFITVTKGPDFSKSNLESYFEIVAREDINITIPTQSVQISDNKGNYITLTLNPSVVNRNLTANSRLRVNITASIDPSFENAIKLYNFPPIIILAGDSSNLTTGETKTLIYTFQDSFCKYGEKGNNLVISDVRIKNKNGDDTEWTPLDEITVDVEVSNEGTEKIKDVYVEIGLIDSSGKNIIKKIENLNNKKIKFGSIDDGKEVKKSFVFNVPADLDAGTYKLVLKAYSDNLGESNLCTSKSSDLSNIYYETIEVEKESEEENHIVISEIKLSPDTSTIACGEKVQLTAKVVNIGDEDYEDQVKVTLYNKELKINQEQIIREDFGQGDYSYVDFEFDIPQDALEKTYTLELRVYYDYDEDDETYGITSKQIFKKSFVVKGNCKKEEKEEVRASITADLDPETPEAVAGKQIIIKSKIKNIGSKESDFQVSIYGHSSWSSLVSINPQTFRLAPGESKDVSIVLNIDENAIGAKEFTINVIHGNTKSEQQVSLDVIQKEKISTNTIIEHLKQNWFIYVIIIVNIILIIAIIAVVKKMIYPEKEYS